MPESLWVADLIISDRTRAKITGRHYVDPLDVRQEIVATAGLKFRYRSDPPRGPRYYVEVSIGGARHLAALYPVAHPMGDVYALGSIYRESRGLDAVQDDPVPIGDEANTAAGEPPTVEDESGAEGVISEDLNVNEIDEQLP